LAQVEWDGMKKLGGNGRISRKPLYTVFVQYKSHKAQSEIDRSERSTTEPPRLLWHVKRIDWQ